MGKVHIAPGKDPLQELAEWAHLSDDQDQAAQLCLDGIDRGDEVVLTGPAGSGKTTLLKYIMERTGRRVVIACPTGKAALRASEVTGCRGTTIHQLLYKKVEEIGGELLFSEYQKPCSERDLLVVDEASMLGSKLYKELMKWKPTRAPILFVGDKEQLEPVNDTWGPDLDNPTAALTEVHRQAAGNPIISLASAVREGNGDAWIKNWSEESDAVTLGAGAIEAATWHIERRRKGLDSTMLTFTHNIRRWANNGVRQVLGLKGKLAVGDRILVKVNSRTAGVMNGEVLNVTGVEQRVSGRPHWLRVHTAERLNPVIINSDLIEANPRAYWAWYNQLTNDLRFGLPFVHVWYGDCLTVHSSQGSQWDEVAFLWDDAFKRKKKSRRQADREFARRFLYTAVTRASDKLAIFAV